MNTVERWAAWEGSLIGPSGGNPFIEHSIHAILDGAQEHRTVEGFYDGEGMYRVRFMPSFEGLYHWRLESSWGAASEGVFFVQPASGGNHGPVHVADQFHFVHADGTDYHPWGTTCYAWTYQPEPVRAATLETLKHSCFNKLRYCVFPKHYNFNFRDPELFPFEGRPCPNAGMTEHNFEAWTAEDARNHWDFTRPNPKYFQKFEACILALQARGIQSDLILFHPYDRWGFSRLSPEQDAFYLKYVIARFAAYRSVWWSMANEYDLMQKSPDRWEVLANVLVSADPYARLRSIHNCFRIYDHTRDWITHASIQRTEVYKCAEFTDQWRAQFGKPVIIDENGYEGNLPLCWGNISGQEMTRRFWEATLRGGYATHGETLLNPGGLLWWSHGGSLHGESEARIHFLAALLKQIHGERLRVYALHIEELCAIPERGADRPDFFLTYYGISRPSWRDFDMSDGCFRVTVIDTWNMTQAVLGTCTGHFRVPLPGREYMAILLERISE